MANSSVSSQIDLREILAIAWRRKWLLFIPIPIVAAIAFGLSYLIEPEYESSTIIQIDPQIHLINEVQRLINEPSNMNATRSNDRSNILRSMYNDITSSHYAELLDQRMKIQWGPKLEEKARQYLMLQPSMTPEAAHLMVLRELMRSSVSVEWASSDQIRIVVTSTNAPQARDMANMLGDIFIAEKIIQDLQEIRSSQDFSDVQLERYERQVTDKMSEIAQVERELARLRSSEGTSTSANRTEVQGEIDQTENEIEDLRQNERAILVRLRDTDGLDINDLELVDSDQKRTNRKELVSRLSEFGDLLSGHTWSDPQVINFKLRQNDLLNSIESENEALVDEQYSQFDAAIKRDLVQLFSIRDQLDYLHAKKPHLETTLSYLAPGTDRIPDLEAQQAQLERELQMATDIRDGFRRQLESSTISQALLEERSSTKYRQVEPAKIAMMPFKPDRKRILLMGIMLGIAIGGGLVLLIELMDNSFKRVEDVEEVLGLKVIGISPKVDFDKQLN